MLRTTVEPVLGTRLTLRIEAGGEEQARAATASIECEAERLEALLSAFRQDSPFNHWRAGRLDDPPVELVEVLGLASSWHVRSGGAFNACLGAISGAWRRAAADREEPDRLALATLVAGAARVPYVIEDGKVQRLGDCSVVDLHGVAKGWVVDRLVDVAMRNNDVRSILVDLGGDLRHASSDGETVDVAIEDPHRVADNAVPLTVLRLSNRAVASSGGGRRGWSIAGRWYGHLLDPATGWPLPERRATTVVAASTAAADAAASAAAAMDETSLAGFADEERLAVLAVRADGRVWRSPAWLESVDEIG